MNIISLTGRVIVTAAFVSLSVSIAGPAGAADEDFAATVERRVRDWQPTRDERLLDQVGWAADLVEARRLAAKYERPLFVFTYSGSTTRANAIALQRC